MKQDLGSQKQITLKPADYQWLQEMIAEVRYVVDQNPKRYPESIKQIRSLDDTLSKTKTPSQSVIKTPPIITIEKKPRVSRISDDQIKERLLGTKRAFTISKACERTGVSTSKIKSIISQLINDGSLEVKGPDPRHTGRGRAPTLYKTL